MSRYNFHNARLNMCYGGDRLPSRDDVLEPRSAVSEGVVMVENMRDRLAETEARLERARAREAELSRQLEEMKKYVHVMEILEAYLRRRYVEQQDQLIQLYSAVLVMESDLELLNGTMQLRELLIESILGIPLSEHSIWFH
ncbi:protein SKIP34 isoform X3 [Andrographis paniculata]|uniref:protein SKIP34 isoform X3 n=1 Tax=Andrographis paniculata TaxID=175694 RepID=UPI0021E920D4|nr:protein SKIP34 isoform X3 [Andrographis paniculata]